MMSTKNPRLIMMSTKNPVAIKDICWCSIPSVTSQSLVTVIVVYATLVCVEMVEMCRDVGTHGDGCCF